MKKIIKIFAVVTLLVLVMWPAAVYADAANDTSEEWNCTNAPTVEGTDCVSEDERAKNIVTYLEEGMASGLQEGKVRTCTRITKTNNCTWESKDKQPEDPWGGKITKTISTTRYVKADTSCPDGATCERVTAILASGGVDLIAQYVGMIYRWAATIGGIVCVLIMIVSGIQISAAGGDTQGVESAKKRIFQSLTALIVLFMSAFILYLINPNFFTI